MGVVVTSFIVACSAANAVDATDADEVDESRDASAFGDAAPPPQADDASVARSLGASGDPASRANERASLAGSARRLTPRTTTRTPCLTPLDCNDGNPCTIDLCVANTCSFVPMPLDDGNPCTEDLCDGVQGILHPPRPAGTACDNATGCDGHETCNASGVCQSGTPLATDDGNGCTIDSCDPVLGVQHTNKPSGSACDNGTVCDGRETCDGAGHCQSNSPSSVDDNNPCTVDSCDPVLGAVHTPVADGTACDNATVCDGHETCNAGQCQAGTPLVIDDGNPCSVDACDSVQGVSHFPKAAGSDCSDADVCNGAEHCDGAGSCITGTPLDIDDSNACTVDSCTAGGGVQHTPIPDCTPSSETAIVFEPRASVLGKLVSTSGGAITGASFLVTNAPLPGATSGSVRTDAVVSAASDGSFRIRLTTFANADIETSPPVHVIVRITKSDLLPVYRDVWLRSGVAADLGLITMIARDSAVSYIGLSGGTASDSANLVQVVIPAGALSTTVPIRITPVQTRSHIPVLLPDNTVTTYFVELEPSGTTFAQPVTVRMSNYRNLPTTLSIPTGTFDTTFGRWEHVAQALWDGQRFAFQTDHFSPYDCNVGRERGPLPKPGHGPGPQPPAPPPPPRGPLPPGGNPKPHGKPDPGKCKGSDLNVLGGAVRQTFALPTYRVRGEDFGLTLGYDSGLASSRRLGPTPVDYAAVPHSTLAMPARPIRVDTACVARASGGFRVSTNSASPGRCAGESSSCILGRNAGVPLTIHRSIAGSTVSCAARLLSGELRS